MSAPPPCVFCHRHSLPRPPPPRILLPPSEPWYSPFAAARAEVVPFCRCRHTPPLWPPEPRSPPHSTAVPDGVEVVPIHRRNTPQMGQLTKQ
uniref:Uncharacterized protein n=1 Tax=Oryza meridionalis TaxID=40149 RepID=A0A0E0E937_9ORYZ